jgi:hypothetical protein
LASWRAAQAQQVCMSCRRLLWGVRSIIMTYMYVIGLGEICKCADAMGWRIMRGWFVHAFALVSKKSEVD